MNVLVVEDDRKIARFLQRGLEAESHGVEVSREGAEALRHALSGRFELVLLDLNLPGLDGFELLRELRTVDRATPVFVISARDAVEDRVRALDLGADDYLVKPFSFLELQARLRAFFRRRGSQVAQRLLRAGGVELDRVERCVRREGKKVDLSAREFQLLDFFMRSPAQPLTRAMISDRVWGYSFDTGTNVIDVYVNYLRTKLRGLGVEPIRTLRGIGYQFDLAPGEAAEPA